VLLIPLDALNDKATEDFKTTFPLRTRENGVLFDLDGDGSLEQVAWTQPNAATAFLAIDKNENGGRHWSSDNPPILEQLERARL
jgi:hypothetical protein